jgi:hypothetical protein
MLKSLSRIDKLVGSVANWAALWILVGGGAILTAALTWVGQYWDWLFGQGWGAVVFAAVGAVCLIGLILALILLAIGLIAMARRPRDAARAWIAASPAERQPEPAVPSAGSAAALETAEEKFDPAGLYVGEMPVSTSKLKSELFVEIAARVFNGTSHDIQVFGVKGVIKTGKTQEMAEITLPAPTMAGRFTEGWIMPLKDTIVAIEQRIPRELAERMLGLSQGEDVSLNLQTMSIMIGPYGDPAAAVRLPTWGGIRIWKDPSSLRHGRITYGAVNITIS